MLIEVKGPDSVYRIIRSLADQFPDFIRILEDAVKSSVIVAGALKIDLQKRQVTLNGEVETQRGKKLYNGDVVSFNGETIQIVK